MAEVIGKEKEKMRKKIIYLEAQIKGNYEHIRDIENDLFVSFWDLMETVNHHFEIENNEYINIIDELIDLGNATVGDYYISLDNQNADNLELLNEAKKELLK
jgi:hypothetical protein